MVGEKDAVSQPSRSAKRFAAWPCKLVATGISQSQTKCGAYGSRSPVNAPVKQRANHINSERSEHPQLARLLERSLESRITQACAARRYPKRRLNAEMRAVRSARCSATMAE
jgi:hypothetical protein